MPDPLNPLGMAAEEPGYQYGALWPVRHKVDQEGNQTGPIEWGYMPEAVRGIVNDLGIAATAPGNALTGNIPADKMQDVAMHAAMGMSMLGTPVGGALAPRGSAGIFGGRLSATADHDALAEAQRLEEAGAKPETIHQITKWFRGPDGKWKYTIPDAAAKFKPQYLNFDDDDPLFDSDSLYSHSQPGKLDFEGPTKLGDVLDHPKLFAAYPHLKDVELEPMMFGKTLGGYTHPSPGNPSGRMAINIVDQSAKDALSTAMHETQHAIQGFEGFARGGKASEFDPEYNAKMGMLNGRIRLMQNLIPDLRAHGYNPAELGRLNNDQLAALEKRPADDPLPPAVQQFIYHAKQHNDLINDLRASHNNYLNLAGEVEARNVEEQLGQRDWTRMPHEYEGYTPPERQIVKFRGQPHAVIPVDHDPFAASSTPLHPTFRTDPGRIAQEHELEIQQIGADASRAAAEKHTPAVLKKDKKP